MKKYIVFVVVLIILLVATVAVAKDTPEGQPFAAIWDVIDYLREQMNDLRTGSPMNCTVRQESGTREVSILCQQDEIASGGSCDFNFVSGSLDSSTLVGNILQNPVLNPDNEPIGWHCFDKTRTRYIPVTAYAVCCGNE